MIQQCMVSVYKSWHSPFFFILLFGGGFVVLFLLMQGVSTLGAPFWLQIVLLFASTIAIFVGVIVLSKRLTKSQTVTLDEQGLYFEQLGRISFRDMTSYDTNVQSYKNRLYLVIRPQGQMSMRLFSGDHIGFPYFCRAFERQVAIEARRNPQVVNAGLNARNRSLLQRLWQSIYLGKAEGATSGGVPVKRSFYGSPLARTMGFAGLGVLLAAFLAAWVIDTSLLFYVFWLAAVGGIPFAILAFGGRAE